jgi:hypothetical protein
MSIKYKAEFKDSDKKKSGNFFFMGKLGTIHA